MNSALKTMGARDKQAYQLDHRQRKYEREQDKRKAQDQKKVFQKVSQNIEMQAENVKPDTKTTEALAAGMATAIGKAMQKISGQGDQTNNNASGGASASISMIQPPREAPSQTTAPTTTPVDIGTPHDDSELVERLEILEETVFNFPSMKAKGYQSGGFTGAVPNLGQPGTGDHFYTHVEPGSYILNRNAVAAMGYQSGGNVPVALEQGEIAIPPGKYDQKILDILNYDMFPRFQEGGVPKQLPNNGAPTEDSVAPLGMTQDEYRVAQKRAKGGKIYLHWAGSGYSGAHSNYHATVQGDGKVIKTRDYNTFGGGHTYGRNSTGIGISLAAMAGGSDSNFGSYPVKPEQYEGMANLVAKIGKEWGWTPANITINNVMTHAEAGSNKDGAAMHDNYGPQPWGGTGERWDLWKLYQDDPVGSGGPKIRNMIRAAMGGDPVVEETSAGTVTNPDTGAGTSQDGVTPTQEAPKGGFFSQIISGALSGLLGDNNKFGLTASNILGALSGTTQNLVGGFKGLVDSIGGQPAAAATNPDSAVEQTQDAQEQAGEPRPEAPTVAGKYTKSQLAQLARSVGFPADKANLMGAIGMAESGGNPRAYNPRGADKSYGLWQINMLGGMGPERRAQFGLSSNDELFDPKTNAKAAYQIYKQQGINAWGAYTNGSYKQFLKRGGQVQQRQSGGLVQMSRKLGNIMQTFMMNNGTQLEREAMSDLPPIALQAGGGDMPMDEGVVSTSLGTNMPMGNLPARDSCPLSIYYRYHPSFNPQGFNP